MLSGGRAFCGLGAAWFGREHELYGWPFPPLAERYELLEDALELLPLMWGKGTPRFEGRRITVPAATCYPRPLQEHVPILVGGSGERRTLRLVARHADACNLFGDPPTVARKVDVLRAALRRRGARPGDGDDHQPVRGGHPRRLGERGRALRRRRRHGRGARSAATASGPRPACEEAIVALHLDGTPAQIEAFAPVIAAFR